VIGVGLTDNLGAAAGNAGFGFTFIEVDGTGFTLL
jgi:hypothetical protein